MEKFQNKYRIPSARLPHWDYGNSAAYFITICTHTMEHYFGEIKNDEMHLNEIGKFAEEFWLEIPTQFPFAQLDVFVIMPNHMHGILIIDRDEMGGAMEMASANNVEMRLIASPSCESSNIEKTRLIASLPGGITGLKNPMLHENISRILRWYKGRCTIEIHKTHPHFAWQPRFHDHVIRDEKAMDRIRNYIINNPYNWKKDKFHS